MTPRLSASTPTATQWALFGAVLAAGLRASTVPGWLTYRLPPAAGRSQRV